VIPLCAWAFDAPSHKPWIPINKTSQVSFFIPSLSLKGFNFNEQPAVENGSSDDKAG
jgi:hypothetical protein